MAETILESVFINIPTHIITNILVKLPPNSLIRCRCVCKAWLNLISEPEFVSLHLSKSPSCLIVHKFFPRSSDSASFNLVEVEDETGQHGVRHIAGMDREIPTSSKNTCISMVGSIDGLVCIDEHAREYELRGSHELIHVWNPIIREFITVQTPGTGGERRYPSSVTTYGFGTSSGKYLVVRIFQETEIIDYIERIRDSTCHVYTIGDGVWKSIGYAPYLYSCHQHGLFFNGNLHWFIIDEDSPEKICCLDLEKELFKPFPPPPEFCQQHRSTLNVYKGCLSVCNVTFSGMDIVIWVMKEYGIQNSWTKEVIICKDLFDVVWNYHEVARIIKVFKDGEILLLWKDKMVLSYHPKLKILQDIDVTESMINPFDTHLYDEFPPCIETTDYVSSIVSLKSLGEVNVYGS